MRMNSTYRSNKQSPVAPLLRALYKRRVLVMLFVSCMLGMAALHFYQRVSVPPHHSSTEIPPSSTAVEETPLAVEPTGRDMLKQQIEDIQHNSKLSAKQRAEAIRDHLERAGATKRDNDHALEREEIEQRRRMEDFMQKIGKKASDVERDGLGKLDPNTVERLMEQRRKMEALWKEKEMRLRPQHHDERRSSDVEDELQRIRAGSLRRIGDGLPHPVKRDSGVEAASWNHFADDKAHDAVAQQEQQNALRRIREDIQQRRHARIDELRNTAFGLVPQGGKPAEHPNDRNTAPRGDGKDPSLRMTFMTTLKSCANESTRFAQLDAVMSWVALPVHPAPNVYLLGADSCSEWVAEHVNLKQRQVFGGAAVDVVHVIPDVKVGPHGTVLLGPAIQRVAMESPNADLFGFINADILLDPLTAVALYKVTLRYSDFFMIAHRASVTIPLDHRASYQENKPQVHDAHQDGERVSHQAPYLVDVSLPGWNTLPPFHTAQQDRQDAEDFFFWSNGFFTKKGVDPSEDPFGIRQKGVPHFHIGRPAYDNWLVHHAIHTWKPVIDGSEMVVAYHQRHDYQHLPEQDGTTGRAEQKSYWGGVEQKENYDLGVVNGGWQHGLIEFAPLGFIPRGCSGNLKREADEQLRHFPGGKSELEFARNKGKMMFDWYASTAQKEVAAGGHGGDGAGSCTLALRTNEGWRPFPDSSPFQDEGEYAAHYAHYEK